MRAWSLTILVICVSLAGCAEPETAPQDAEPAGLVTDPTDYSYLQDQTEDGGGWHVHDYWGQQDALEIIAATEDCPCSSTSSDGGVTLNVFRPEPDHVIPQGARWINITPSWTIESGDYTAVELHIKTAAMSEPVFISVIESGEPVTFESTNEDNDPPHHVLSLWEFHLVASNDDEGTVVSQWTTSMEVTAARGLDIPPYPPHPDFWQGQTEIDLADDQVSGRQLVFETPDGGSSTYCFGGCLGPFTPADGKIVPFDARDVVVRFDFEPGTVPNVELAFHGAGTWDFSPVEPAEDTPDHRTWIIDVQDNFGDSPYAKQSLWEFRMYIDDSTPARGWEGTIDYSITAVKDD